MGIELSGFRNAIAQDGQFLSVSGQDLSEVKATDLKLEQVQDPTGMNQAASNIYLRGQLLTGIRESLLSSKLMCVARDPANANKEILVFQDKNVQKFFEDAEKQLFGVVSTKGKNKGQYGIATASQNLESQTVKDLIARLNEMMPPAGKPQVEQKNDNINNINNINNVNNKPDDEVIVLGGGNSNPFDLEGSENVRIEAQRPPVEEMSERNPVDSDVLIESKEESGHVEDDFGLVPKNMRSKDDVVPVGAKEVEKEGTVTIKTVSGERTETYEWELYDVPDAELTAAQRLFREKQPNVTDRQRAAMTNPDFGKLAACLKQDVSIVKNLQLSDVEPMANGRDFVCTLALSGGAGSVRVLVAPDGQFVNYADYQKCREILQESPDAFAATDLRDVAHVMSFMRTKDGDDTIGEFKLYSSTLKAMLPTALAKARQTVPEGDIPLSVWWNALGFEGAAPADDSTRYQGKVSFLKALQQRAMDDYNAAMGKADTNWPSGDSNYKKLIESKTYFSTLFELKYPQFDIRPTDEQVLVLVRPDSKVLANRLGVSEEVASNLSFGTDLALQDGLIACTVTRPGGTADQILIDRDGSVVQKSAYDELQGLLTAVGVPEVIEAFRKEDIPAAAHFCKMIFAAADDFADKVSAGEKKHGRGPSWGWATDMEVKSLAVNLLISSLPSVVNKHPGAAPQDLYADMWKELRLAGKAPRGGDPQAGGKFLDAVRKRFADDVISGMGIKGDMTEVALKMLLPNTEAEHDDALEKFGSTRKGFGQFICSLVKAEGLSFDKRMRVCQGRFLPKLKDLSVKTMRSNVKMELAQGDVTGESLLYNKDKCALVFGYDGRQTGTQYNLDGKHFWTIRKNRPEEKRDPGNAIETLRNAQFSPQQIFQLGMYLNNYAMNLAFSMGVLCVQSGCEISIHSDKRPKAVGDMFVRARMPVARFHKLEMVGKEKKIEMFADQTNEFIVHDFVIHKDGTMTMKDLNVSSPAHVVHDYRNIERFF